VQVFAVVEEGDYLTLQHEQVKFGRLTKGLCRHLRNFVAKPKFRFQALISSDDLAVALRPRRDQPLGHLPAEINIYGPKVDAAEIGSTLSRSRIFLQLPLHDIGAIEYYNPQLIKIEGHLDRLPIGVSQPTVDNTHGAADICPKTSVTGNDTTVDSILDSLSHHNNHNKVKEIAVVPDITSRLFE
jgi:hypothetical protein